MKPHIHITSPHPEQAETTGRLQVAGLLLYGTVFGTLAVALGQAVLGAVILVAFAWGCWLYFGPVLPHPVGELPEAREADVVTPLGRPVASAPETTAKAA